MLEVISEAGIYSLIRHAEGGGRGEGERGVLAKFDQNMGFPMYLEEIVVLVVASIRCKTCYYIV